MWRSLPDDGASIERLNIDERQYRDHRNTFMTMSPWDTGMSRWYLVIDTPSQMVAIFLYTNGKTSVWAYQKEGST